MEDQGMKILAGLSILAFVGFLAFRNKEIFKSEIKPDIGISKTFYVLIFAVPIILALLYSMKSKNRGGITPVNQQQTFQEHREVEYDSGVKSY